MASQGKLSLLLPERERERERERESSDQSEGCQTERERERGRGRERIYSFRPLPLMKGCRWMTYHLTVHTIIMPMSKKINKLATMYLTRY